MSDLRTVQHALVATKSRQGMWEMNLLERQLTWSSEQYKLYGYEPDELQLDNAYFINNTTHPSDLERITGIVDTAIHSQKSYHFKRRIIRKNGSMGYVQTDAVIVRNRKGLPTKILGTTTDIGGCTYKGAYDYCDPLFFDQLFKNYRKTINHVVLNTVFNTELAHDLTQEILMKAWHHMAKYDPQKGALYTWLINIANNHCKDYFRSKQFHQRQTTALSETLTEEPLPHEDPAYDHICLKHLLLQLSLEQRELMDLVYTQGFSQTEIAVLWNIPLGTVKSKIRSALIQLRKFASKVD